jgi:hypothetical protein
MKKLNLFMASLPLIFFFPGSLFSYELSLYNIEVPSSLEKSVSEFVIRHRFYEVATEDPLDNLFGIDQVANVSVGLKYVIVNGLEADVSYTRDHKEYTLGLAYSHSFPEVLLKSRADVEFFSFEELGEDESLENFFYQLVLQGEPLEGRIKLES